MRNAFGHIAVGASITFAAVSASAAIKLAGPFTDGAVLQRQKPVPVWGKSQPGSTVKVSFAGAERSAEADAEGRWRIDLPAMEACREGRTLAVGEYRKDAPEKAVEVVEVKDLLVGEVWFVSGQSNMEMPLVGGPHFSDRNGRLMAQKTNIPLIRFCNYGYKLSDTPLEFPKRKIVWKKCTPENLMARYGFSALGFYYGLELYNTLQIPIGLIGMCWGGSLIDAWTPREGLATRPDLKDAYEWPVSLKWDGKNPKSIWPNSRVKSQSSIIWNAVVNPFCPYAMRGLIWYQGESNVAASERYASQMHALYNGWSIKFENPDMKLYFVQLAPKSEETVKMWEAQFAREEKNAAMTVINDIGNINDIHPNEKGLIGLRLSLHALKRDYGFDGIQDNSPTLSSWKVEGDTFLLYFNDAARLYMYTPDFSVDTPFEIAGEDGVFKPAKIVNLRYGRGGSSRGGIVGTNIVVRAEGVMKPVKLRYAYSSPWKGTIYNEADLPLGAFKIGY
jgi:sialate O-acetylesterase